MSQYKSISCLLSPTIFYGQLQVVAAWTNQKRWSILLFYCKLSDNAQYVWKVITEAALTDCLDISINSIC